jgi:putative chitinase
MSFQITSTQLAKFAPRLDSATVAALTESVNAAAAKYGIDQSPRRLRYFMTQSYYETEGYTKWSENLVYTTPQRLCVVWDTRFTMDPNNKALAYAPLYVNNAQKLSNCVYANRFGNGNEASGDGWTYRGRGGFHLTFKSNYAAYSQEIYGDDRVVLNPDLVAQPADAMMSAGSFWNSNHLGSLADSDSFTLMTDKINGSTDTVPLRLPVLNAANSAFSW